MWEFISKLFKAILMNVYTQSKVVRVDLMPSGTAYSAGDVIGTAGGESGRAGKLCLKNALREPTRSGILNSLTIFDSANQKPALTVLLFSAEPPSDYPDNSKPQGLSADADGRTYLLGRIDIASADWKTISGSYANTAVAIVKNIGLPVHSADGVSDQTAIWAVVISEGAPDWVGSTVGELVVIFGFLQD